MTRTPDDRYMMPLDDFPVGDCVGMFESSITLRQPDMFNRTYLTWDQWAYSTDPSSGGDIWHGTFYFYDFDGNNIYTIGPLDGRPMKVANQINYWNRTSDLQYISPDTFNNIYSVRWKGQC